MNEIANPPISATAVFYQRSTGVKFFRAALSGAQAVAPRLAIRLAQRLCLTPLPPKWLQRRHAWNPSWLVETVPFEAASLTVYRRMSAASDALTGAIEGDKPHVLLIHGWGGSAAQMHALADGIADGGMVPVVIEAPGHGRSKGLSSSLPQFARALDYMAGRLTMSGVSIQGVVAHSLGASAAAFALARGLPATRLVLIAPPERPRDFTKTFAQVFGLSEHTRAGMQTRIEAQEAAHMELFSAQHLSPQIAAPTLIVHDEIDPVNSIVGSKRWLTAHAGARLLATRGLGHRKILADRGVIDAVSEFLARG